MEGIRGQHKGSTEGQLMEGIEGRHMGNIRGRHMVTGEGSYAENTEGSYMEVTGGPHMESAGRPCMESNGGTNTEGIIDLHTHTTASDGSMTPEKLVLHALHEKIRAIAITDHDTIDGVEAAYLKGLEVGLEVVPGVEISTGDKPEIHILGYFPYEKYKEIDGVLDLMREKREIRNLRLVEKIREFGAEITMEDVIGESGGHIIGRMHIAKALCRKGYAASLRDAFARYLLEGCPTYVSREKIPVEDGIREIRKAGGVPVLAHPKFLNMSFEEIGKMLGYLKEKGLMGLEVYYPDNTAAENEIFRNLALKNKLIITGGTDFHGDNRPEIKIGRGMGGLSISYAILEHLKKKIS